MFLYLPSHLFTGSVSLEIKHNRVFSHLQGKIFSLTSFPLLPSTPTIFLLPVQKVRLFSSGLCLIFPFPHVLDTSQLLRRLHSSYCIDGALTEVLTWRCCIQWTCLPLAALTSFQLCCTSLSTLQEDIPDFPPNFRMFLLAFFDVLFSSI